MHKDMLALSAAAPIKTSFFLVCLSPTFSFHECQCPVAAWRVGSTVAIHSIQDRFSRHSFFKNVSRENVIETFLSATFIDYAAKNVIRDNDIFAFGSRCFFFVCDCECLYTEMS